MAKERYNRKRYHFSQQVKTSALEKTNYRCFVTGEPHTKDDPIQIHHFLAIRVWYDHFRDQVPSAVITSVINAVPLKETVHKQLHEEADLEYYRQVACFLMSQWKQQELSLYNE